MPLRFIIKNRRFMIEQADLGMTGNEVLTKSIHFTDEPFSVVPDKCLRHVEYRLCGTVIIREHNFKKICFIIAAELFHILNIRTLEAVDALVIITHHKYVW